MSPESEALRSSDQEAGGKESLLEEAAPEPPKRGLYRWVEIELIFQGLLIFITLLVTL